MYSCCSMFYPRYSIKNIFGKNGVSLWFLANGIDDRGVENSTEAKSISNEFTFDSDTNDRQKIKKILMYLSEKVSARLREEGFRGKTITLKIRLEGFSTYNRSVSLIKATNFVLTILFFSIRFSSFCCRNINFLDRKALVYSFKNICSSITCKQT